MPDCVCNPASAPTFLKKKNGRPSLCGAERTGHAALELLVRRTITGAKISLFTPRAAAYKPARFAQGGVWDELVLNLLRTGRD